MERIVVAVALWLALGVAQAAEYSTEYKLAVISAGRFVSETDTSVVRAKRLVNAVSAKYNTPPDKAADMIGVSKQELSKTKIDVDVLDVLDGALVLAGSDKKTKNDLADYIAAYITLRMRGMSHHEAVKGYIGLPSLVTHSKR